MPHAEVHLTAQGANRDALGPRAFLYAAFFSLFLAGSMLVLWLGDTGRDALWPLRKDVFVALARAGLLESFQSTSAQLLLLAFPLVGGAWLATYLARAWHGARGRKAVWAWIGGAVLCLPHVLAPPFWSDDTRLYALYGRQIDAYDQSPLSHAPRSLPRICVDDPSHPPARPKRCDNPTACPAGSRCRSDPFLKGAPWTAQPSAYGPIALALFSLAHRPGDAPPQTVARIRLLVFAVWMLGVALAGYLAGSGAIVLTSWHPIAWMEVANAAHVDAVVAVLALACALAAVTSRRSVAPRPVALGAVAGLAGAIKASFAPTFAGMLAALRRPPHVALRAASAAALAVAASYAIAWTSPHPFAGLLLEGKKTFLNFPHLAFIGLARAGVADDTARRVARLAGATAFVAWAIAAWRRTQHDPPRPQRAVAYGIATSIAASFLLAPTAWPWHLLPAWMLATTLAPSERVRRALTLLVVTLPLGSYGPDIGRYALGLEWLPGTGESFEHRTSLGWLVGLLLAWAPLLLLARCRRTVGSDGGHPS